MNMPHLSTSVLGLSMMYSMLTLMGGFFLYIIKTSLIALKTMLGTTPVHG